MATDDQQNERREETDDGSSAGHRATGRPPAKSDDSQQTHNDSQLDAPPSDSRSGDDLTRSYQQLAGSTVEDSPIRSSPSEPLASLTNTDLADYFLEEEVARGGMGVVFKAKQKSLNRIVALKVILAGEFASSDDVQRFKLEAESAANLVHPCIVPIYEVGEFDGRHFFSMGFIDGASLKQRTAVGPVDGQSAASIIIQVADAIGYAHDHGVVHRDLKPSNILLDRNDTPHVTDFGLAKRTDGDSQLTGSGQILGTPGFMAPEQALGNNTEVGPLADVYALGAVLYSLLTARPPFSSASPMDTLMQVVERDPVSPRQLNPDVERDLDTICLKCLRKAPADRYQSAQELKADLQRYLNFKPIKARPVSALERIWRWSKRNSVTATLGLVVAVLLIGLSVFGPAIALHEAGLRQQADDLVTEKESLIGQLNSSIEEEEEARKTAESAAQTLNANLVNMYVDRGTSEMVTGNAVIALPWFAAALKLDAGEERQEWAHRFRLASLLMQAPRPRWSRQMPTEILCACVSTDGRLVAAGTVDGEIAVWKTESGDALLHCTQIGSAPVREIRFSPTGHRVSAAVGQTVHLLERTKFDSSPVTVKLDHVVTAIDYDHTGEALAVGLSSGDVSLHDSASGTLLRHFPAHANYVHRIDINSGNNRLISTGTDHTVRLSDLSTGEVIAELEHEGVVVWGEFSPDGTTAVTASEDGTARLWNAETGSSLLAPLRHPDRVRVARFDSTGSRVATGCYDSAARIWDVATGDMLTQMKHENSIPRLAFSSDDRQLITASNDHTARIWATDSGNAICPALHHGFILADAAFLPEQNRAITAGADRLVRAWDFQPQANLVCQVQHQGNVKSCRFNTDATLLATASADGKVIVSSVPSGEPRFSIDHGGIMALADFSRDGRYIVTGSEDGRARVWSAQDGQPVTDELPNRYVWNAEFDSSGNRLLVAGVPEARIWEIPTGRLLHTLKHKWHVRWARFSPDGELVLTCGDDGLAKVWNSRSGEQIAEPLRHAGVIHGGAFSPDSRFVVTGSRDHSARIWDLQTAQPIGDPLHHSANVQNVQFTPDGRHVVTGSSDGTARIWNSTDGLLATPPLSMGRGLIRTSVSPCGRFVATAGFAPTASGCAGMLWDVNTGHALGYQITHAKWVNEIRFSHDSRYVATASEDGTARVWAIPEADSRSIDELLSLAQVISGHRADPVNGLVPVDPENLDPSSKLPE